jgi:hypothetical protein
MSGLLEMIKCVVSQPRRQRRSMAGLTGRDRNRQSGPAPRALVHHRSLRVEPMEERTLLSVGLQFDHLIYNPHAGPLHFSTPWVVNPADVAPLSSSAPVGMTPQQIRTAYGINSIMLGSVVGNGSGQTIAIIDCYDDPALLDSTDPNFATSDLHKFDL